MTIIKYLATTIFSLFVFLFFYICISFPEGVKVLTHYIFGGGKKLEIKSDYFPESPVIQKNLKSMQVGQTKIVRFKQYKDWRLSYALNPFRLKKVKNGFEIYQYIEFDRTGTIYTIVNLFGIKIKIYDNWINFFNPTPFMLTYSHYY